MRCPAINVVPAMPGNVVPRYSPGPLSRSEVSVPFTITKRAPMLGIEIFPIPVWSQRTNRTVFTDVRVPKVNLVGEPNQAWTYMGGALDFERATIGGYVGSLQRLLDGLIAYVRSTVIDGTRMSELPHVRAALSELAILAGFTVGSRVSVGAEGAA